MIPESHKEAVLDFWHRSGVRTPLVLEGDCMAPMLNNGDEIVIAHGDDPPRFGEIVAFRRDGRVLVQRAIGIRTVRGQSVCEVKPDNDVAGVTRLAHEDLVGLVIEVRNANGRRDLRAAPGRLLNLLMGCRSYFAARCRNGESSLWRAVASLSALRKRLLPRAPSLALLPLRFMWRLAARRPALAADDPPREPTEHD